LIDVEARPNSSTRSGGGVDFVIRNEVNNIVLKRGICHVSKGRKGSKLSPTILSTNEASVKLKTSILSAGRIKSYLVYELVNQRNENEPVTEDHQAFIAVRIFARPRVNKYKVSTVMFMVKSGKSTGRGNIKRLHKGILRKHLVDNVPSFECAIKDQTLRLEAVFHPDKAIIKITLKEIDRYTDKRPILLE
jgi:hypothetical protein